MKATLTPFYRLILFCALLFPLSLAAQPSLFTSVGIGGGGPLHTASFSLYDSNEIYLSPGLGGLYRTSNMGESWSAMDFRQLQGGGTIRTGVQYTSNVAIMYTIDFRNGGGVPVKSYDRGLHWTALANEPTRGKAVTMAVDPTSTDRLIICDNSNIYFSSNGGTTFRTALVQSGRIGGIYYGAYKVYVGTDRGLYYSPNYGENFTLQNITGIPTTEGIVSLTGAEQNGYIRLFCVTFNKTDIKAGLTGASYEYYRNVYMLDVGHGGWVSKGELVPTGLYPFSVTMAPLDTVLYLGGSSDKGAPVVIKAATAGDTYHSWSNVFLTGNNQNIKTGWGGDGGDTSWTHAECVLGVAISPRDPKKILVTDRGFADLSKDAGAPGRTVYVSSGNQNPANAPIPKGKSYEGSGIESTPATPAPLGGLQHDRLALERDQPDPQHGCRHDLEAYHERSQFQRCQLRAQASGDRCALCRHLIDREHLPERSRLPTDARSGNWNDHLLNRQGSKLEDAA